MNSFYKMKYILAFIVIATTVTACDSDRVYDKFKDIKDGIWNKVETIKFDVSIDDTIPYHKVFINVRNKSIYKFSNLYIFLNTTYPDGKTSRDTIDCLLADDKGKWLGKGLGDLKDCRYLLKNRVKFHQKLTSLSLIC